MRLRPRVVGALVTLVGAALILLFWVLRGADAMPEPPAPTATSAPTSAPSTPPAVNTAEPPSIEPARPTDFTLRIPGVSLEADLHPEGLREGKINPPAGTVMWYTGHDRVAPGDSGTAVIAGHVVAAGQPDRFADLAQVQVGDEVELVSSEGATSTFTVVRAEVVDKDDLTTDADVWGANPSVRRLAIVTCDDAYGFRSDGHRVANFVVIAEATTDPP